MIKRRDGEQHARPERVRPGEAGQRVPLPLQVAPARGFPVRIIRYLIIVSPQRGNETDLIVRVAIVDERAHAAESPHAVVQNIGAGSLESVVAAVAVQAGIVRELLRVAAEVQLVIGLVKRAEGREQFGFIVTLEACARNHIEHAISAVAIV